MAKIVSSRLLFLSIKEVIQQAQKHVVQNVNSTMVLTYFEIGRMIVDYEQNGKIRADYAKETLKILSDKLTNQFGKGYSIDNLERIRKFYLIYNKRISASLMRKFENNSPTTQNIIGNQKSTSLMRKSKINIENKNINNAELKSASLMRKFKIPFSLSWTHYLLLIKIEDDDERNFYEIEAVQNNWSVRELQRQFNTALYNRLAKSRDKKGVKELAKKGQLIEKPSDALKSHYVLEFLNLKEVDRYTESDFESAIIDRLEEFMLELGKGFLYEGRQKRFTFEGDSFYVDLVFYNRYLRCFVLFDLKIGKLTHQDIGQMQMYVNYYDRKVKSPQENKTIGIILCKQDNKTVVEFTLPESNNQIFAKEFKQFLPTKAEFKKYLQTANL
jgi:predicted nuclease of restriction endonuclease-like (RecB) superfamily